MRLMPSNPEYARGRPMTGCKDKLQIGGLARQRMRLAPLLAMAMLLVAITATSGCIFSCGIHGRTLTWEQDDVPLKASEIHTEEYETGNLWGGVSRNPNDNRLTVDVFGHNPVSQQEAVEFTESLFASKGWPEPRLENATVAAGCEDDF